MKAMVKALLTLMVGCGLVLGGLQMAPAAEEATSTDKPAVTKAQKATTKTTKKTVKADPKVKAVQEALKAQGYKIKATGKLGKSTTKALKDYQKKNGLKVTGKLDQETLDKLGVKYQVVGEYWPKLYEPDYTSYITAIMRAAPDVLIAGFWGGDTVSFIKQAKPYKLFDKMKYFHVDAGGNYEALAALGADMPAGLILSARHHNNWPGTPAKKAYVQKFYKATGRYPSYAAEGAYVGIHMIAEAIRKVGNANDTEALIKAMDGMKVQSPEDPPGFTSYIDPKTHQIVQVQAIGTTVKNDKFPPAKYMLGNFKVYPAEKLWPNFEYIEYLTKVKGK